MAELLRCRCEAIVFVQPFLTSGLFSKVLRLCCSGMFDVIAASRPKLQWYAFDVFGDTESQSASLPARLLCVAVCRCA